MSEKISVHPSHAYVSTRVGFDPVKTIYLCPPAKDAASPQSAEAFAVRSGWQDAAEKAGAILVTLAAPDGWDAESCTLFQDVFNETRNSFSAPSEKTLPGLSGKLMCWEPIIYGVGYAEGASFLGDALVTMPNTFAAAALVNGTPHRLDEDGSLSNHWYVKRVSDDYAVRNQDIPIHAWIFHRAGEGVDTARFFADRNKASDTKNISVRGHSCQLWQSTINNADQVRLFEGEFDETTALAELICDECFAHVVRWKDGPDGKLAMVDSCGEFYQDPRFVRRTVTTENGDYDYFVHLPDGMSNQEVKGLPLVFTVHGRGEPAWMFTCKNGWDLLADETREFVLVSPDSPGNIWFLDRDGETFVKIVEDMAATYQIDPTRVYLTGFSNGAMISREVGIRYPHLFAAISAWNGPCADTITMRATQGPVLPPVFGPEMTDVVHSFLAGGWEMPCAFIYGDSDNKSKPEENVLLPYILTANGCHETPSETWDATNHYTPAAGYSEGERFTTQVYGNAEGKQLVLQTIMKNMPHGACFEESRATWEFIKHFRRPAGSVKVEEI